MLGRGRADGHLSDRLREASWYLVFIAGLRPRIALVVTTAKRDGKAYAIKLLPQFACAAGKAAVNLPRKLAVPQGGQNEQD